MFKILTKLLSLSFKFFWPLAIHHCDGQAEAGDQGHGWGKTFLPTLCKTWTVNRLEQFLTDRFQTVQIQPDLRELMETMNRMSNMPPDSEAKDKVSLWLVIPSLLSLMQAQCSTQTPTRSDTRWTAQFCLFSVVKPNASFSLNVDSCCQYKVYILDSC